MTNRIVLSVTDGLKISKPGINVLTAADKDLSFSSAASSFPVEEVIQFRVAATWGDVQTATFSQAYSSAPLVSVYTHGTTNPTGVSVANQKFFCFLQFSKVFYTQVRTYVHPISGHYTLFRIRLYNDRITFQNIKGTSGIDMTPYSGYLSIVVHGTY